MKKKKQRRRTFLTVTVERTGSVREAGRILSFVMCWTWTHATVGHRPSAEEYAVDWNVSAATAYRELKAFREAWPEFSTPSEVADALGVDLAAGGTMPNPAMMPAPGGA